MTKKAGAQSPVGRKRRETALVAIGVSVSLFGAHTALAQKAPDAPSSSADELQEVVVTGIRASLDRSLGQKRDSGRIVDAISAEDVGKFPSRNVADALGNIPGVVVSRTRGAEGQYIGIRGLGEDFALVTLNKRILATDNVGRSFAFDVLPSEMISGAEVSKSVQASQMEGGIGGTVDLRSARPFDFTERQLLVSAEGEYGDLAKKGGMKVTGVASTRFNDDRMGALVSVSYSKRNIRTDNMREYSIESHTEADSQVDFNGNGQIDDSDDHFIFPSFYSPGTVLGKRERTGVSGAFQWQATDAVLLTVDGLFTRYDSPTKNYAQSNFLSPRISDDPNDPLRWSNIQADANGVITHYTIDDMVAEVLNYEEPRTVDTSQFGVNAKWQATDRLEVGLDGYWSQAKRDSAGQFRFVVAGIPGATGEFTTRANEFPDLLITLPGGRPISAATNDDYRAHYIGINGDNLRDKVYGASLDNTFKVEWGGFNSVQFGAAYTKRNKDEVADNNDATSCNFCGYPFTFGSIGADVIRPPAVGNLLSDVDGNFPRMYASFDIDKYLRSLKAAENNPDVLDPTTGEPYPAGYSQQVDGPNPVGSFAISEKTTAGYVQGNFSGDSWRADVGVRLVHTTVDSAGASNQIISITKIPGNTADYDIVRSDATPVSGGGSYSKVLPSANFSYDFRPDLRLRVAAAEVMARPSLDQLSTASDDGDASSGTFVKTFFGNPNLRPTTAHQADTSLEWYFTPRSLVALALFYKDVKDFVTSVTADEPYAGQTFTVTRFINGDSAKIKGAEIAIQHFLPSGLGVQASFTRTSSRAVQGDLRGQLQDVTPHSYRVALIYEHAKISGQISYSYDAPTTILLSGQVPGLAVVADDYKNASFTLGYALTPQISLFAEGSNLLDESIRQYNTYRNVPAFYEQSGRSYFFGVRARL
ncbi:MAG: TonB-dependent receptor [Gammaproteobacteria bacterium]